MTENDILSQVKETICQELNREADKEIKNLCDKLKSELEMCKNETIAGLLNGIDAVIKNDDISRKTVFQINIRGGNDGK